MPMPPPVSGSGTYCGSCNFQYAAADVIDCVDNWPTSKSIESSQHAFQDIPPFSADDVGEYGDEQPKSLDEVPPASSSPGMKARNVGEK